MEMSLFAILVILFITVGPMGPTGAFQRFTATADENLRRKIAFKSIVVATGIALLFIFAGAATLKLLHISMPAMKVGGGLVLALYAIGMIMGTNEKHEPVCDESAPDYSIAVFPMAMPLIITPQGITAIILIAATVVSDKDQWGIVSMLLVVMVTNLVCMLFSKRIMETINPAIIEVFARIFGLLLTGLAMQIMVWGLMDLGFISRGIAS